MNLKTSEPQIHSFKLNNQQYLDISKDQKELLRLKKDRSKQNDRRNNQKKPSQNNLGQPNKYINSQPDMSVPNISHNKFVPNKYDLDYLGSGHCVKRCGDGQDDKVLARQIEEYKKKAQKHCQKIKNLKKLGEQTAELESQNQYLKLELEKLEQNHVAKNRMAVQANNDLESQIQQLRYQVQFCADTIVELEQKEHRLKMENQGLQRYIDEEVPHKIKQEKKATKQAKKVWKKGLDTQHDLQNQLSQNRKILGEVRSENVLKSSELESQDDKIEDLKAYIRELERQYEDYIKLKQKQLVHDELVKRVEKMDNIIDTQNQELQELREQLRQQQSLPALLDNAERDRNHYQDRLNEIEYLKDQATRNVESDLMHYRRLNEEKTIAIERLREQINNQPELIQPQVIHHYPAPQIINNPPPQRIVSHPPQQIVSHPPQQIINHPPVQQRIVSHPPQQIINHPPQQIINHPSMQQRVISHSPSKVVSHPPQQIVSHALPTQLRSGITNDRAVVNNQPVVQHPYGYVNKQQNVRNAQITHQPQYYNSYL